MYGHRDVKLGTRCGVVILAAFTAHLQDAHNQDYGDDVHADGEDEEVLQLLMGKVEQFEFNLAHAELHTAR